MFVPVAQLDRVFGYEPKGQGFESLQARQRKALKLLRFRGFCCARLSDPMKRGIPPARGAGSADRAGSRQAPRWKAPRRRRRDCGKSPAR